MRLYCISGTVLIRLYRANKYTSTVYPGTAVVLLPKSTYSYKADYDCFFVSFRPCVQAVLATMQCFCFLVLMSYTSYIFCICVLPCFCSGPVHGEKSGSRAEDTRKGLSIGERKNQRPNRTDGRPTRPARYLRPTHPAQRATCNFVNSPHLAGPKEGCSLHFVALPCAALPCTKKPTRSCARACPFRHYSGPGSALQPIRKEGRKGGRLGKLEVDVTLDPHRRDSKGGWLAVGALCSRCPKCCFCCSLFSRRTLRSTFCRIYIHRGTRGVM